MLYQGGFRLLFAGMEFLMLCPVGTGERIVCSGPYILVTNLNVPVLGHGVMITHKK